LKAETVVNNIAAEHKPMLLAARIRRPEGHGNEEKRASQPIPERQGESRSGEAVGRSGARRIWSARGWNRLVRLL